MTSGGNSALLPANVGGQPPLQRGLMNFQVQNFQLYNKSLKDWSLGKQLILFPSKPVIKCLFMLDKLTIREARSIKTHISKVFVNNYYCFIILFHTCGHLPWAL